MTHGLFVRISYDFGTSICINFSSILVDATTKKDCSITKPFFPEWPDSKLVPWHPHLQHVVKWHYMVFPNIKLKTSPSAASAATPTLNTSLHLISVEPQLPPLFIFFMLFHFTTALESNINPRVSSKPQRARRRGKVTTETISHPVELRLSPAPSRVHSGACVCHPQTSAEGVTTLPNPTPPPPPLPVFPV